MITSDLFGTSRKQPTGCVAFVVFVVMPIMSVVVATLGFLNGATLTLRLARVEPRVTEEVLETSGVITRPVERVLQEGRVHVTVTRRLLGLVPIREMRLHDVVEVGGSSGTQSVRDRSSGRTPEHSVAREVIGFAFVFVALLMIFVALRRLAELLGWRQSPDAAATEA